MPKLVVQSLRDGKWLNVTSVQYDDKTTERERERARSEAFDEAERARTSWRGYHLFVDTPLRIAEMQGFSKMAEARR